MNTRPLIFVLTGILLAGCAPQGPTLSRGADVLGAGGGVPADRFTASGVVRDMAGIPVQGARIRLFDAAGVPDGVPGDLVDRRANPLVSNNSGGLVSNHASGWGVTGGRFHAMASRRIQALPEVVTDPAGRYSLVLPAGRYNLEATAPDGRSKAWQADLQVRSGETSGPSTLTLSPTGTIRGRVKVADSTVSNLLRTQVFVPGSSYAANTAADGTYVISDMPVGGFPLFAWHPDLGEAYLDGSDVVQVASARTSQAPDLVLRPIVPVLDAIVAPGTDRTVTAAAPGTALELTGRFFGATSGRSFKVAVQGVPALDARRLSDSRISFTVPPEARNGTVTLEVGTRFAEGRRLRVIKSVRWKQSSLVLAPAAEADLHDLLDVRDTEDTPIVPVREGSTLLSPPAEVAFTREDDRAYVTEAGVLKALAEGTTGVTVKAGSLPPRFLAVSIQRGASSYLPGPAPEVLSDGRQAPDDSGDPRVHHDYDVVKEGVISHFVWIPRFRAYQLMQPSNCGPDYLAYPVGSWVASPSRGIQNRDWAVETFGGFYAGKFEASHADAVPGDPLTGAGAMPGVSTTSLKVARFVAPWTEVTFEQARAACEAYDRDYCHLMASEEWTALAVWSMIRGVQVHGNNRNLADADDPAITFTNDPTHEYDGMRALTGSGKKEEWSGDVNETTHTGSAVGVHDLNGNVGEWITGLGGATSPNTCTVNEVELQVGLPAGGLFASLSTDERLRRHGLPATTVSKDPGFFGGDFFVPVKDATSGALRGGTWNVGFYAGVWQLMLDHPRTTSDKRVGFRPVLRF